MFKLSSWFSAKNKTAPSFQCREDLIKSLIVQKQSKEFCTYLRRKDDRTVCINVFFQLLSTILDDEYMHSLFQMIIKKSGFKDNELSTIITNQLSSAILSKNFDFCEKILHLPFPSLKTSLPTYELTRLFHTCDNPSQLIDCLSILIEKSLPHDSEYLSWILIILFEHYRSGDEIIIEHLLTIKKQINLLFTCYGNNNVTPLMLFLHLYSNPKCQILLDHYFSNINDPLILLQCDKWNRSYLMHLLCGRCEHESGEDPCLHTSVILARFAMLHKLGNKCENPTKNILTSGYCLPLRMVLLNYLAENDTSFEFQCEELFLNFPSQFIAMYAENLKEIIHNRNLDSSLVSLLLHRSYRSSSTDDTIKFLLQQGARIQTMDTVQHIIFNFLAQSNSMLPFLLLDYSFYIDIPFEKWVNQRTLRMDIYICRVLQCGYPSEMREKFAAFKSHLAQQTGNSIEKYIDLKSPPDLAKLCLQKLRSSMKNLGDQTIDQFKDHLPIHLRQSITAYGYDECQRSFQSILFFGQ